MQITVVMASPPGSLAEIREALAEAAWAWVTAAEPQPEYLAISPEEERAAGPGFEVRLPGMELDG